MVPLNRETFLSYFALNPNSPKLSEEDRKTAQIWRKLFFGFTLGIGYILCRCLYNPNKISLLQERTGQIYQKTQGKAQERDLPASEKTAPEIEKKGKSAEGFTKIDIPKESALHQRVYFLFPHDHGEAITQEKREHLEEEIGLNNAMREEREKEFNNYPFADFKSWKKTSDGAFFCSITQSESLYNSLLERVNKRIQTLNRELDFEERTKKMGVFSLIQMGDVEAPWEESAIRLALLSEEEIGDLTLKEVESFTPRQMEMLKMKSKGIRGKERTPLPNDFRELSLAELSGLKPEVLSKNWKKIPLFSLPLLEKEVWEKADLTDLSSEQFKTLFLLENYGSKAYWEAKGNIESFSDKQIYECWSHLMKEPYAQQLKKEQLQKIDFATHPLTQKQFDALFPKRETDKMEHYLKRSRIPDLLTEQLYPLRKFLDQERLSTLSDQQLQEIDLTRFFEGLTEGEKETQFRAMFYFEPNDIATEKRAERNISRFSIERLYLFLPYLKETYFNWVTEKQLKEFNFDTHPLTQEQFDALFPKRLGDETRERYRENSRIKVLSTNQLFQLKNFLDGERLYSLSDEQLRKIDLSDILAGLSREEKINRLKGLFYISAEGSPDRGTTSQEAKRRRNLMTVASRQIAAGFLLNHFGD